MMNLFMVSLGGKVKGCNIEVHDVRFIIANHIDETVELLKSTWYGLGHKLHMDSYKTITGADGYKVQLTKEKTNSKNQLFFVQFGGYKKTCTQELHDIGLFVGESEEEVEEKALKLFQIADIDNHVDSILPVETVIRSCDCETYYLELLESDEDFDQSPDWFGYRRLDLDNK